MYRIYELLSSCALFIVKAESNVLHMKLQFSVSILQCA